MTPLDRDAIQAVSPSPDALPDPTWGWVAAANELADAGDGLATLARRVIAETRTNVARPDFVLALLEELEAIEDQQDRASKGLWRAVSKLSDQVVKRGGQPTAAANLRRLAIHDRRVALAKRLRAEGLTSARAGIAMALTEHRVEADGSVRPFSSDQVRRWWRGR